jgi:hypothetical protein
MNLEDLTECTAEQLEKMTDEQLLEHFKSFLDVTRPDRARTKNPSMNRAIVITPEMQKKMAFLEANGIDPSFIKQKRK